MLAKALSAATAAAAEKIYIESVFSTFLYTGNGSTQTITNGIDLSGKGGLVWTKQRLATSYYNHSLYDTARGTNNRLSSNTPNGAGTPSPTLTAFNANGFTIGSSENSNSSGDTSVSWTFRKAAKFFDVVSYTGSGANRTIAHNLGSVPGCIIVKSTSQADNWKVYHRSLTSNAYYILLDSTAAQSNAVDHWNNTTPTSTEFSISSSSNINTNGATYVAYLFAHDAGGFGDSGSDNVISCGTYTADGGGNATVTLGWEPQFVLFKRTNAAQDWFVGDNMRGTMGGSGQPTLRPNTADAESLIGLGWTPTATGFQAAGTANAPYIYIAIRRGPMKTPTDATKVYSQYFGTPTDGTLVTTNFPVDFLYQKGTGLTSNWHVVDRLRGYAATAANTQPRLQFNTQGAESDASDIAFAFDNVSYKFGNGGIATIAGISHAFRRAPGFFDVVAYTGNGTYGARNHSLGVAPELVIIKARSSGSENWGVNTASKYGYLNTADAFGNYTSTFTSTTFTAFYDTNTTTYIAYLFATCPGVSKVGSYTGTGTTKQIDCGFTVGARFVLIKRTDSTGDWYVWDTARGIISGNDPYLLLNSTAAEVTNTDYIDPLNSGFEISSTAPAAINANGGSFIYLAIA